jgi:hypothetical protein
LRARFLGLSRLAWVWLLLQVSAEQLVRAATLRANGPVERRFNARMLALPPPKVSSVRLAAWRDGELGYMGPWALSEQAARRRQPLALAARPAPLPQVAPKSG